MNVKTLIILTIIYTSTMADKSCFNYLYDRCMATKIDNNESIEIAKNYTKCGTGEVCGVESLYNTTDLMLRMNASCVKRNGPVKENFEPLDCKLDQKENDTMSLYCICTVSRCNDIFPFRKQLAQIFKNVGIILPWMSTTSTTTSTTTTTATTTTKPTTELSTTKGTPFMCFHSDGIAPAMPKKCPLKKCTVISQQSDGKVISEYGCLDTWTSQIDCHNIDGSLHCFCAESYCNSKSWAEPKINDFFDKKRFTCHDYSGNSLETTTKSLKCNGPPQCVSYLRVMKKDEKLFEGGCVDGSKHESLYPNDCYSDKDYPDGPLFVCYCSEPNCNSLDVFDEKAQDKDAYAWAEKAYKELNNHRGHECLSMTLMFLSTFLMLY